MRLTKSSETRNRGTKTGGCAGTVGEALTTRISDRADNLKREYAN